MKKFVFICVAVMASLCAFAQSVSFEGANVNQFQATMANNGTKMFNVPLVGSYELVPNASHTFTMNSVIRSTDLFMPAKKRGESKETYAERLALVVKEALNSVLEEQKAKALFLFAEQENADLIVSPVFAITTKSSNAEQLEVEVKVKGMPARYTSIRPLQASDPSLIKITRLIHNDLNTINMEITSRENEEVTKTTTVNQ